MAIHGYRYKKMDNGIKADIDAEFSSRPTTADTLLKKRSMDENNKGRFVKITVNAAKIYKELIDEMPIVGISRSGEKLEIISEDNVWYYVKFYGMPGYLSKKDASLCYEKKYQPKMANDRPVKIYLYLILLIIMTAFMYLLMIKMNNMMTNKDGKKTCIIISRRVTRVKFSNIRKRSITLEKYFKRFNYTVSRFNGLNRAGKILSSATPDMICVDCQISNSIFEDIFKLLKKSAFSPDFVLIFYNTNKLDNFGEKNRFEDHTFFLGRDLRTYDLNKVLFKIKPKMNNQSNSTYIEGRIAEETIQEVLQMIDFNRKTGYLYVENTCFSGMLFFEGGVITYAITDSSKAEDAIYEIISMKNGTFRFIVNKKPLLKQLHLSVMTVLLERAKFMDEKTCCSIEPFYNFVSS